MGKYLASCLLMNRERNSVSEIMGEELYIEHVLNNRFQHNPTLPHCPQSHSHTETLSYTISSIFPRKLNYKIFKTNTLSSYYPSTPQGKHYLPLFKLKPYYFPPSLTVHLFSVILLWIHLGHLRTIQSAHNSLSDEGRERTKTIESG